MSNFRVFTSKEFDREYSKLDKFEQKRVDKILAQLTEKGGEVGKPLAGPPVFREKKFDGKRLYYLVYSDVYAVLALAISDKKAQQATINQIRSTKEQRCYLGFRSLILPCSIPSRLLFIFPTSSQSTSAFFLSSSYSPLGMVTYTLRAVTLKNFYCCAVSDNVISKLK